MSTPSNQFNSFIDRELNLPPPGAIDHIENDNDDDDDSDRYELWTFRVPSEMKVSDLNGVEIDLEAIASNKQGGGMKINDGKFTIHMGETVENKNLRVLVPNEQDDDEDDDDDSSSSSNSDSDESGGAKKSDTKDNKFFLHPSSRAFSRHFNVHAGGLSRKTEAELAPLVGPKATDDVLRHAYSHIPQRTGLKRRWMPLGAPQSARDIAHGLVTLQPDKHKSNGKKTATAVCSEDDEIADKKVRRKRNADGVASPKKKRIKKERGAKSAEKAANKSAKKAKKQRK
ncbi:unnamed protein product [Pseudo-nitzschia multistriata]|uniref:Uncharacterized protein n=1 Tax=Pseudo-nitzschia multistriata TaxID=183589 RepID=A0A448ZE87_9STRA|nr:unnamed protein product [Pseudo-nitzschia multistriata]